MITISVRLNGREECEGKHNLISVTLHKPSLHLDELLPGLGGRGGREGGKGGEGRRETEEGGLWEMEGRGRLPCLSSASQMIEKHHQNPCTPTDELWVKGTRQESDDTHTHTPQRVWLLAVLVQAPNRVVQAPTSLTGMLSSSSTCGMNSDLEREREREGGMMAGGGGGLQAVLKRTRV